MAGISRALNNIDNGYSIGTAIEFKAIWNKDGYLEKLVKIKWDKDSKLEEFFDYGADIRITNYVKKGSRVALIRFDSYGAVIGSTDNTKGRD
ncbi:hypothetical protein LCGC14_3141200 [marine sediment metagenome]|uniref:Uncharacterized protein n=1 Tax=marine sediment metagenome TaxID=412755 RepID=A0A0F8YL43_9ZZZZ